MDSFWASYSLYICDVISDTDLFMNFTEVSLTDPFIAMFIAAQTAQSVAPNELTE